MKEFLGQDYTQHTLDLVGFIEIFQMGLPMILKISVKKLLHIDDTEKLIEKNRIFRQRSVGIGKISVDDALEWGFLGLASELQAELGSKKKQPYDCYKEMDFKVPTGSTGDCFERFLVRVEEMRQSVSIIRQCLKNIPDGPSISNDPRIVPPKREIMKESMESLINHFKLFTEGFHVPPENLHCS